MPSHLSSRSYQHMEDKVKKVEDDIEKVSKTIEGLLALQEEDKASFVLSGKAATLQYWQDEKHSLRRKEELLLLQMSQRESSAPAPPVHADPVLLDILKKNLDTSEKTYSLLSRKFESKQASKLSPGFFDRLPLAVTDTGILKESSNEDFDTILQLVKIYAAKVQLLLREHGIQSIDEKLHMKPLSMALLQSVVDRMLSSLDTTISTEKPFRVAICFDNVTTRVRGCFDKAICFNAIKRRLLVFEDKNPSVSVDSYMPVSQTASQVISISRELAKCYNIAFPRIVGFICNGIEFTKVEYGLLGGEEHINLTPKETLIDTSHGDFTINEGATTAVAKYLIHGVIIARNLFHKLRKMPLDFKDDVINEEKDEALDDSEGDEGEDKDVMDEVLLPLQRTALTSIVEDNSGKHPMNLRSSQRPGQAYFQPFLTEELLFQHTLMSS